MPSYPSIGKFNFVPYHCQCFVELKNFRKNFYIERISKSFLFIFICEVSCFTYKYEQKGFGNSFCSYLYVKLAVSHSFVIRATKFPKPFAKSALQNYVKQLTS